MVFEIVTFSGAMYPFTRGAADISISRHHNTPTRTIFTNFQNGTKALPRGYNNQFCLVQGCFDRAGKCEIIIRLGQI